MAGYRISPLNSRGYGSNKGTAEWAVGPELYAMVRSETTYASKLASALIAKDTGKLAASANPTVETYAGATLTAWQGYVTTDASHPWDAGHSYGAAHEFGWFDRDGKHHPGGHELETTLRML